MSAGSVCLWFDPAVFKVDEVLAGKALEPLIKERGGAIFNGLDPFDGSGNPVPGGLLLAWVASLTSAKTFIAPGENEIFIIFLSAAQGAQEDCSIVQFVEGLRSKPDSPLQKNAVTVNGTATIAAATEDLVFCLCKPLDIEADSLPEAGVQDPYQGKDFPYSQPIPVSGGIPPYRWEVKDGSLPPGLSLDPLTGWISGTPLPKSAGSYPFTVQICDACLCEEKILRIEVIPNPPQPGVETAPLPRRRHGGGGCGAALPISRGDDFWDGDGWSGISIYGMLLGILLFKKLLKKLMRKRRLSMELELACLANWGDGAIA
ncbi:MAG: putative Ig domain-containing protein [Planctomycetes bacterium]|nr:putative Ig domain-containing protein [Planctomycetota bacterium]